MKRIQVIVLLVFIQFGLMAQNWNSNFEKSKETAQKENKKIVLVFSGSDWCSWCIKLENEILEKKEFLDYAKDNFVLLKADFPRKKKNKLSPKQHKHNIALLEKYNPNGYFPIVVVINSKGKELGRTGYKKMLPKEYAKLLDTYK